MRLLTRREFLNLFYQLVYKARCLVVGFDLSSEIARLAFDSSPARGFYAGGFSFCLWSYKDSRGRERANTFRPRICVKHIDRNRSLIGFTARNSPDQVDFIPEGSPSGKPQAGYRFRGHFLFLRSLAFALTDEGYSLEAACDAFGVEHRKQQPAWHGPITQEEIDGIRGDVLAMSELAAKLVREFAEHPIPVSPTHSLSPASIGKGYLRSMGISPVLKRQPNFPKEYLGYAQTAFFGGRTSVHVRKIACPVVCTDFLSMYSTINTLMGLWSFVIANEIRVIEHRKDQVETFLRKLTPNMLFEPETWKRMNGFVKVVPNGDVLPIRSKYSPASNDWQVGLNHVYAKKEDALWYSIPDVVASVLATGRVPEIIESFLIEPSGVLFEAVPTKLRGMVEVDPERNDFFKVIVEERLRLSSRSDLSDIEIKRLATWGRAVAPVAEWVAQALWSAACGVEGISGRYCRACAVEAARKTMADAASLRHMKPKTKKEKERLSRTLSKQAVANTWWDPSTLPNWLTEECYIHRIQPLLRAKKAREIAAAIQVSELYAGFIRSGRRRPHPRHWQALAGLVGLSARLPVA